MLDYATLRLIWWVLLGLLLIGFAVMDGFDLGVGMLLYPVARKEEERRLVLNTIGPVWEGNQIWLVLGGGAIFAAWPSLYAVSFSGFYFAMLLVLLALIIRPVGFKYRSKLTSAKWRAAWDAGLFIAGFLPALLFGVAVGNVLEGVPFSFDNTLRDFYLGTLWGLLNPFALLCGLVSIAMLVMHGGTYLAIKTLGDVQQRAVKWASIGAFTTVILFAIAGLAIVYFVPGYLVVSGVAFNEPSNPLYKHVIMQSGAWLSNYYHYPWFISAPVLGFAGTLLTWLLLKLRCYRTAWVSSAMGIAGMITTVGVSMFPFILPSSSNPSMSLLIWDASSSQLTLFIMLIATIIFLPIILLYTSWVYYILRGKVTDEYIQQNQTNVY
jgi:cytochrome d ubiquinol oxidase subunit II